MELDWIIQEPIDFEYKQYLILDYVKKAEEKVDRFEIYPTFQELAIHFASMGRIKEHGQFITLKRLPEEIDDEILITDLIYNTIRFKDEEEKNEILSITEFAYEKFKDLFMITKSAWSIVNESVSLDLYRNKDMMSAGHGTFHFEYDGQIHVYEYKIQRLSKKTTENKCFITKIYEGDKTIDIDSIITTYSNHDKKDIGLTYPIFKVSFTQSFPLEGSLLSLTRRKIMNYIFQSVKIKEIKEQ